MGTRRVDWGLVVSSSLGFGHFWSYTLLNQRESSLIRYSNFSEIIICSLKLAYCIIYLWDLQKLYMMYDKFTLHHEKSNQAIQLMSEKMIPCFLYTFSKEQINKVLTWARIRITCYRMICLAYHSDGHTIIIILTTIDWITSRTSRTGAWSATTRPGTCVGSRFHTPTTGSGAWIEVRPTIPLSIL